MIEWSHQSLVLVFLVSIELMNKLGHFYESKLLFFVLNLNKQNSFCGASSKYVLFCGNNIQETMMNSFAKNPFPCLATPPYTFFLSFFLTYFPSFFFLSFSCFTSHFSMAPSFFTSKFKLVSLTLLFELKKIPLAK